MIAQFVQDGRSIDYTPGTAVDAGDVVVVGNIIGIAKLDIAADALGALAVDGVHRAAADTNEWTFGQSIYWDADTKTFTSVQTAVFAGTAVAAKLADADTGLVAINVGDPDLLQVETETEELTDNSGGTASETIAAIGATYDQAEVRNAVASLAAQVNLLRAELLEAGLLAVPAGS